MYRIKLRLRNTCLMICRKCSNINNLIQIKRYYTKNLLKILTFSQYYKLDWQIYHALSSISGRSILNVLWADNNFKPSVKMQISSLSNKTHVVLRPVAIATPLFVFVSNSGTARISSELKPYRIPKTPLPQAA